MKIKENLVLRQVADTWTVLPLGRDIINFDGMLTLNDTGAMLWQKLEQGADMAELVKAVTDEYDVAEAVAAADVEEFLGRLAAAGALEE